MATYVLVHGGAHGGWCYQRVARILRSAGHEVYAPTMTGVGERSHLIGPEVDLDMHIDDIAAVLRYEDLRDVILVGHSYGGMVITGTADRAAERIGAPGVPRCGKPREQPVARRRFRAHHRVDPPAR
jgi:pimeloyl-ACP methyl ester carboxylesterase